MKNTIKKSKPNYKIQIALMILLAVLFSAGAASAATYTVTNTSDSGAGSVRQAILDSNASAEDDTINFDSSLVNQTILLTSGELVITADSGTLFINGLGASQLTISGGGNSRIFFSQAGTNVAVRDLTVTGGNGNGSFPGLGGGILNSGNLTLTNLKISGSAAQTGGGGIYNNGTLTMTNSTVSSNSVSYGGGGGIYNGNTLTVNNSTVSSNTAGIGGGIYTNSGTLKLNNSTVSGNSASFYSGGIYNRSTLITMTNSTVSGNSSQAGDGGGIYNLGPLIMTNSTVSGNSAAQRGGGISNDDTLTMTNSTISGNSASFNGGDIYNSSGTTNIRNSIIANSVGGDCFRNSGTINAEYSLFETGTGCVNGTNSNNLTGDPLLGPLQDNGGSTFTHELLAGSPAIDAGSNALVPAGVTTDQRGAFRIVGTSVDIGAFESDAAVFTVNTTADSMPLSPTCQPLTATTDCTLRQAVEAANAAATDDTILFTIPTTDAGYDPLNNRYTVMLGGSELTVTNNGRLFINGLGASQLTISGGGNSRIFFSQAGTNVAIRDLTVTGGNANGSFPGLGGGILNSGNLTLTNLKISENSVSQTNSYGGGIYNNGTLTMTNSTVSGNSAVNVDGGGIFNNGGTLTVNNSTVSGNSAAQLGGGIYNKLGTLTMTNSTVSNNSTEYGGGIANGDTLTLTNSTVSGNSASRGGGINNFGALTMINSTVSGNSAAQYGGGIYNIDRLTLTNSTVSNNSAVYGGGGIYNGDTTNIRNSIIANSVGGDCFRSSSGTINAEYSLIEDGTGYVNGTNSNNLTGDPLLGPLQDNGGSTFTHELLVGSPAINAGSDALAVDSINDPLTTDQRGIGFPRIIGRADIGAFESSVSDLTPPVITPNVSGTLGNNDWYIGDIEISWSVSDDESSVSNQTGCETTTVTEDTSGITFTCMATSAGGTSSQNVTVKRDATAPGITYVSRTAANSSGWNNSDVTVNWTCTDSLSGVVSPTDVKTVSTEGLNQSVAGNCTDNAGNSVSDTQSGINIDLTAPTLSPTVSPNPVLLNGSATASPNASDTLSGIASQSCDAVVTSTVGNQSVNCTATDLAGNTANAVANYQVVYNFAGFFQPVDNLPTVNIVSAGQAIPLKFSLNGNQGMGIFAAGYPASSPVACDQSEPGSTIEETVNAGGSSLTYDAATDRYSYIWKTNKAWKGSCRILVIRLIDGTEHYAKFRFK